MNAGVNALRFLFIVYVFVTFILALVFSGVRNISAGFGIVLACGFVLLVVSGAVLQIAHKTEKRSAAELIPALLYPVLAYYLMFFSFDLGTRRFWIFIGFFQFLVSVGGFLLGILLAPVIARPSYSKEQVAGVVRFGLGHIKSLRRETFAVVLLTGVTLCLAYVAWRLVRRLGPLTSLQQLVFYASLAAGIAIVLTFTYRHTVFNLMKDATLKQAYAESQPLAAQKLDV